MQNGQNDNLGNEQDFPFTPTGDGGNPENTITIDRDLKNVGNSAVASLNLDQEIPQTFQQSGAIINTLQTSSETLTGQSETIDGQPINDTKQEQIEISLPPGVKLEEEPKTDQNISKAQIKMDKKGNISPETFRAIVNEVEAYQKPNSNIHPADIVDMKNQATEDYVGTFENPFYTGGKAA